MNRYMDTLPFSRIFFTPLSIPLNATALKLCTVKVWNVKNFEKNIEISNINIKYELIFSENITLFQTKFNNIIYVH